MYIYIYHSDHICQYEDTLKNRSYLPRPGFNPEPLHVEQKMSGCTQNCTFHWMHFQRNTFLVDASSGFYWGREIMTVHIVHTISFND